MLLKEAEFYQDPEINTGVAKKITIQILMTTF